MNQSHEAFTFTTSLSQQDWSLHRKGPIDAARHAEKVKEAIRENLADIVADEPIITSDGHQIVKIPIRSLDHPRFRYDPYQRSRSGTGDGKSKAGDVIGKAAGKDKNGSGKQAGDQPGIDYYEAEITVDDLAQLIFEDLELPGLQPKSHDQMEAENVQYNDIRKKGIFSNLDKKRTIMENIKRNAMQGDPRFKNVTDEDLRFRTWQQEIRKESKAVVIAMRDVSASMGEFEKYISRGFYFWMVRFLREKYQNVEIVFITHHTEAQVVDEDKFFKLGESGGTRVSSAYQKALDLVSEKYNPDVWNIYPFHFSDGDNWEDDNEKAKNLVAKLLEVVNVFGYGEIHKGGYRSSSTLKDTYSSIQDERFIEVDIEDKKGIYPALQRFFSADRVSREGAVSRK